MCTLVCYLDYSKHIHIYYQYFLHRSRLFRQKEQRDLLTDLVPSEVADLLIVCELEIRRPLESMLGVLNEGCTQQLAGVLLRTICE